MKTSLFIVASLHSLTSARSMTSYPGVTFLPSESEAIQVDADKDEAETIQFLKDQHKQYLLTGFVDIEDGGPIDQNKLINEIGTENYERLNEFSPKPQAAPVSLD